MKASTTRWVSRRSRSAWCASSATSGASARAASSGRVAPVAWADIEPSVFPRYGLSMDPTSVERLMKEHGLVG